MSVIQQSKKIFETSSAITKFVDIFNVDIARIQIDGEGVSNLQVKVLGRLNPEQGHHEILMRDDRTGDPVSVITSVGIFSCDVSGYIDLKIDVQQISGTAQFYLASVCITPEGEMADIPAATETSLGGIKVGNNLSITPDGTLSAIGGGGSGTSDYDALTNIPTLNGVKIVGNKTAADYGIKEDKTYTFVQNFATTEWNITHNLNKYPAVIVVDDTLTQVMAEVQYINLNTIKIKFSKGFTGKVFLN